MEKSIGVEKIPCWENTENHLHLQDIIFLHPSTLEKNDV